MRRIEPYCLWIGNSGDAANTARLLETGVEAIVDLAANELPLTLPRDLIYCRFPLVDAQDAPSTTMQPAIETLASLLRSGTPTFVFCSGGMSRSPAVAAAALAIVLKRPLEQTLEEVTRSAPADVSPGLLCQILALLRRLD
jgi:protein-tyrosine phosphatase